ncbi:zf-HC2 domain-containing protein [Desulfoscipio gibsoniae]|uniref:Anti-sigma-W factor RsiW n=1 Tax=Desulfoscipio gibsoniae DSM 7213 TaxID=767817 RepID=R4KJR6_9FIRM|nr:zf-HC2 domain-containing protein [Desulfoscipio gibsoniae]AGL00775.1 hypothetical protein Desgi_1266 [Desulfoscipio gibsoniae DSM 7213]
MQCRDIYEMLSPYIDGMLESSQVVQVEEHIAACEACRLEYDDLLAAVELVRGLPEVVPPPEFHDNLRQKIDSLPAPTVTGSPTGQVYWLARGKWLKILTAAAVLFITVGVTVLYYDKNDDGVFDTAFQLSAGQNTADRVERFGGGAVDGDPVLDTAPEKTSKDIDTVHNNVPDTNRRDLVSPGVSKEEVNTTNIGAGEQPASAAEDGGTDAMPAAGGGEDTGAPGKQVARELAAPQGQSDGNEPQFSIMAVPQDDLEDAAGKAENDKLSAATNLHVAREFTATVVLKTQSNTAATVSETVARYGGFVETEPQQNGRYWVLRIPTDSVDGFINELSNLGQSNIQSTSRDLTVDLQQAQEQLNVLLEQEKTLLEQQDAQKENRSEGSVVLDTLRGQIALQQQVLAELQQDIDFTKFNLYLQLPPS